MLFQIKTRLRNSLDLLLFGFFVAILAGSILVMNSMEVRSLDDATNGARGQLSSHMPSGMPSEMPSQFPIYLPFLQRQ